jgi:hypothetical protein
MHFGTVQDYLRKLDQILCAMAGVVDMTDELADAEKTAGKEEDCQASAYRQSRAYEVLEPILTDAMRWSGHTREEAGGVSTSLTIAGLLAGTLEGRKAVG